MNNFLKIDQILGWDLGTPFILSPLPLAIYVFFLYVNCNEIQIL
jgi:hypothetical protein